MAQHSQFSGVVYAPNASISIGARSSGNVNYFGSFVGDTVSTQYANIHYDQTMSATGGNGYAAQLVSNYSRMPSSVKPQTDFWYFNIASWQEWGAGKALPSNQ